MAVFMRGLKMYIYIGISIGFAFSNTRFKLYILLGSHTPLEAHF